MVFKFGSRYKLDKAIHDYFGKIRLRLQQVVNFENISLHIRV